MSFLAGAHLVNTANSARGSNLNTPKQQTECTIQEVEPFKTPLPKLDKISTSKEITARVLGISTLISTVHAVTAFTR